MVDRNRTIEHAAAHRIQADIDKQFEEANKQDRGESRTRGAKRSWTGRRGCLKREERYLQTNEENHRKRVEDLWREDTIRANDARARWVDMEIVRARNSGEQPFWATASGQDIPQNDLSEKKHGSFGERTYRDSQESECIRGETPGFGDSGIERNYDSREAENMANKRRRIR